MVFLDIKKITVFIGNQGSGKSTVAKLISTCSWLEKALNRGDVKRKMEFVDFTTYCSNQGIHNYFIPDSSQIEYIGDAFKINYDAHSEFPNMDIQEAESKRYKVPQIIYVPSERNFLSIIRDASNVTGLPVSLSFFADELIRAQRELNGQTIDLPINEYKYEYIESIDRSIIISGNDYTSLLEASSGLQSAVPLYLVSRNLSSSIKKQIDINAIDKVLSARQRLRLSDELRKLTNDHSLPNEKKVEKEKELLSKYHNSCFINIVEEPEQNLFPDSQRHILNSLLEFANKQEANELLMTTHSPYIINYLSIAIQGKYLLDKINASSKKDDLLQRLNAIVPIKSCVAAADVAIYQFQDDGTICLLSDYEGIPSDKNYLNQSLAKGNQLFDALLEIEEEL